MKELRTLKIDSQLRDLFPPLTKDEYSQLEQNIIRDGCISPLFIWDDFVIDGHNRYKICTANRIPFDIITLSFDSKSAVIQWMIDTQLGRRNLTPIQRIAVIEKYRPVFEEKAKENISKAVTESNKNRSNPSSANLPNLESKIDTRKELAKLAGTSERTYGKAAAILHSDNEDIKQDVMSGKKSIDAGYNEIKPKQENPKETTTKDISGIVNNCEAVINVITKSDIYYDLNDKAREKVIDSLLNLKEKIDDTLNSNLLTSVENPTGILSINDIKKKVKFETTDDCDEALSELEQRQYEIDEEKKRLYILRQQIFDKTPDDDLHCEVEEQNIGSFISHKFVFYIVKDNNRKMIDDFNGCTLADDNTDLLYRAVNVKRLPENQKTILLAKIFQTREMYIERAKQKKKQEVEFWEQIRQDYADCFRNSISIESINSNPLIKDIINAGYRSLTKKYHPDVINDDGKQMQMINEAKEVLDKLLSA